jgi:transcription initiation factor TFIIH subunit 4
MNCRLPNLAIGVINRESFRAALIKGITAEQVCACCTPKLIGPKVIHYLEQNAHKEMKKNVPILPETLTDQIRLWEAERNRVSYAKGVMYDTFPSTEAFLKVEKFATEIGAFIWSNHAKGMIMVTEAGHEQIRPFIKKNIS